MSTLNSIALKAGKLLWQQRNKLTEEQFGERIQAACEQFLQDWLCNNLPEIKLPESRADTAGEPFPKNQEEMDTIDRAQREALVSEFDPPAATEPRKSEPYNPGLADAMLNEGDYEGLAHEVGKPNKPRGEQGAERAGQERFGNPLVVTKDGVPLEDQAEGIRQFKEAAERGDSADQLEQPSTPL